MPKARTRAVRELRDGVWEVDIIDSSCKRLRRRFRAESADEARDAALASLPCPKACTLHDALERYFDFLAAKGTKDKTIAYYRGECKTLSRISGRAIDSITPRGAARVLANLEARGVSRWRCYRIKTLCGSAAMHAVRDGLCDNNPFAEIPFKKPRPSRQERPIPPAGLNAARAIAKAGSGPVAVTIGLTLGCGLKPGEIAGILSNDLDPVRRTVTLRGEWRTDKPDPDFYVPYPAPVEMALPDWLGDAPRSWAAAAGGRHLIESCGRRCNIWYLRLEANTLLRAVGAGCTIYALRCAHDEEEA